MKSIILFYSYTGTVRKLARGLAGRTGAELYEIKDYKRPGKLKTFFVGCPRAMKGQPTPIERVAVDLSKYDKFIVMAPVWASNPAPPVNNVLELLPRRDTLSLFLVSSSGSSAKKRILARLEAAGFRNVEYMDIKRAD